MRWRRGSLLRWRWRRHVGLGWRRHDRGRRRLRHSGRGWRHSGRSLLDRRDRRRHRRCGGDRRGRRGLFRSHRWGRRRGLGREWWWLRRRRHRRQILDGGRRSCGRLIGLVERARFGGCSPDLDARGRGRCGDRHDRGRCLSGRLRHWGRGRHWGRRRWRRGRDLRRGGGDCRLGWFGLDGGWRDLGCGFLYRCRLQLRRALIHRRRGRSRIRFWRVRIKGADPEGGSGAVDRRFLRGVLR